MTQHDSERDALERTPSRPPSRLAAGVTGAAVAVVCVGYVAWSLFQGQSEAVEPAGEGIALSASDDRDQILSPPPIDHDAETPLSLDDTIDLDEIPVINAHLEVPVDLESSADRLPQTGSLQQLGHETAAAPQSSADSTGAWLTGTIEPAAPGDSHQTISRFLR
ncbi:MAG: hypothetical protein M3552_05550 [Planctomycetota bacterium]|nr:hypothetical protein [Planctomycetaceae bacterium]MDQ3330104.1 hypothetical protein [Planctomycetota bacterium]